MNRSMKGKRKIEITFKAFDRLVEWGFLVLFPISHFWAEFWIWDLLTGGRRGEFLAKCVVCRCSTLFADCRWLAIGWLKNTTRTFLRGDWQYEESGKFDTNTFYNLRQIHFTIWDKYILTGNWPTKEHHSDFSERRPVVCGKVGGLRQIHLTIWDKYILQFKTNTFSNLRQIHFDWELASWGPPLGLLQGVTGSM